MADSNCRRGFGSVSVWWRRRPMWGVNATAWPSFAMWRPHASLLASLLGFSLDLGAGRLLGVVTELLAGSAVGLPPTSPRLFGYAASVGFSPCNGIGGGFIRAKIAATIACQSIFPPPRIWRTKGRMASRIFAHGMPAARALFVAALTSG